MESDGRHPIVDGVRAELARRKVSQREAGEMLGMSKQAFSKRMTGSRPFRAQELADLAAALGIPVSRFFSEQVAA
jgi:transcriptional regulator with XRE-family HTH domain